MHWWQRLCGLLWQSSASPCKHCSSNFWRTPTSNTCTSDSNADNAIFPPYWIWRVFKVIWRLHLNPTLGLGQGNAAAGPSFLAISSLIVNLYLHEGHGARTMTSLTHCLFILAAVLYVDDTDNIHMTPKVTASASELIQHAHVDIPRRQRSSTAGHASAPNAV